MNEDFNQVNPMAQGPETPGNGPSGPVGPMQPPTGPVFKDETNFTRIYQIGLGVLGFLLLVALIFIIVYYNKANKSQTYINGVVQLNVDKKVKEAQSNCDQQKKDIRENPWTEYTARQEFGSFKFVVPRNWSQYENFDINANEPYSVYFSPDSVRYDSDNRNIHSALEATVSKKLYADEIKEIEQNIKISMDTSASEEKITISNFTGTKFVYNDKTLGRKIGLVILPYRDRALFIKTDDYNRWSEKYYTKFYQSFALTP